MELKEVKKIISNTTLETLEMNGAHIISKHLISDKELMYRCKNHTYENEHKQFASSFNDSREKALELIKNTLLSEEFENPEVIKEWLDDNSDGEYLCAYEEFNEITGRGFIRNKIHNWEDGAIPCYAMKVILKKVERKYDTSFKIVTAYPTLSYKQIVELEERLKKARN